MPKRSDTATFVTRMQQLLYRLAQLMERCDQMCLAQHNITVSQGYAIMSLPQHGELSMNELSGIVDVAGSTATRMVDQLVKKGLAARQPGQQDRRIVRVALTKRGQDLRKELEAAMEACFTHAFAGVAEGERTATVRVLESITTTLSKGLETNGCVSCKVK